MSVPEAFIKWGGLLFIGAVVTNSVVSYISDFGKGTDSKRLKDVIAAVAPIAAPENPRPLLGQKISPHRRVPTGSIVIDFMRTDFMRENKIRPGVPKAAICQYAMQRLQIDILGLKNGDGLDIAYQLQFRWRCGNKYGDTMTSFPRPFNIIFHDPNYPQKDGVAFSIRGFSMQTGEVFIGDFDRSLPTMYFKPNDHDTLIYCTAAKAGGELLRDPNAYESEMEWSHDVKNGGVRPDNGSLKRVLPRKQLVVPNSVRNRTYGD